MRRVPEVLDCWFESGSMPFAQVHYPFENADWFEHHYPGDFIVEYNGQTRGWFYTMHVLATALFDRPAFRTCVAHGIVLGDDGQKMSKRLRNYPDVYEVFDRDGSDAMRWFLMSSPVLRGGDLVGHRGGHPGRACGRRCCRCGTSWYFFALYANADVGSDGTVADRLAARAGPVRAGQDRASWSTDVDGADGRLRHRRRLRVGADYLDALTNWYVRRSRRPVLGRRPRTRSTRCTPCWRCSAGWWRRCCR